MTALLVPALLQVPTLTAVVSLPMQDERLPLLSPGTAKEPAVTRLG